MPLVIESPSGRILTGFCSAAPAGVADATTRLRGSAVAISETIARSAPVVRPLPTCPVLLSWR
jgi:hypothetical protein